MTFLKPIWQYRDFIFGSVKREFRVKYQNSILGVFWVFVNPLAMILVYTLVFSQLMKAKLPNAMGSFSYSIYLCAGILSWGLFAEISTRALNLFLDNANLLKKIYFPRACLPIILVINAWINFAIIFGMFIIFLFATQNFPGMIFLAVIPILLLITFFALALGVGMGVLNVFYRDIGQVYTVFLQFWFWLTPIVYTSEILPSKVQALLQINPLVPLISGLQRIVVLHEAPLWDTLIYPSLLTCLLILWSAYLAKQHQHDLIDEL